MPSFPASKYARYKRATAFFLDWLLRARGRGRGHHTGKRLQLQTLSDVVEEIAEEPTSLTPKLLQDLPKALAACQCAIILREHVATFFSDNDEAQDGHQHFLKLLRGWHSTLMHIEVEPEEEEAAAEVEHGKFENYYGVLEVDEDYFPDDKTYEEDKGATKRAKINRKKIFAEAFAADLKMEMAYFFLELDELMEGVWTVYAEVKEEKRSLVEATVVARLAVETASALTAQVQLKYPSLRTAESMFNIVRFASPEKFRQELVAISLKYMGGLEECVKSGKGIKDTYVPGIFFADFVSVGSTLNSFRSVIPRDVTTNIAMKEDAFGEPYNEESTPHYVTILEPGKINPFLMQQLEVLYNSMADLQRAGYKPQRAMEAFLVLMIKYFKTRVVTIPVVFACICWVKSVAALQGDGVLSRSMSITIQHSEMLLANAEAAMAKGTIPSAGNDLLYLTTAKILQDRQFHHLTPANPLYAGETMLDHHLEYLNNASIVLMSNGRFRAFGHLYNALVKEGYLEDIPFVDEVLDIYAEMIFTPSRDAAVPGAYYRTYLLSGHVSTTTVDAVARGRDIPAGQRIHTRGGTRKTKLLLSDVSKIYCMLMEKDKSFLRGSSWKGMLEEAASICFEEMFGSRVLSRDALKLFDDLLDVFSDIGDAVDQGDCFEEILASSRPGESPDQHLNNALEESVMQFLMPFFDALRPDDTIDMSAIPGDYPPNATMDPREVKRLCRAAAEVIKDWFAAPPADGGQEYFTFPATPDFISQEFEVPSRRMSETGSFESSEAETPDRPITLKEKFAILMYVMRESNGPLPEFRLDALKDMITTDRTLLQGIDSKENGDLCTLFHQAAAGPAHDAGLVDWMIQRGALVLQPLHCRKAPDPKMLLFPQSQLPNTMAVHSAAIAGYDDIVRTILQAESMIDMNTPTFHTKETLAHLAVKHGHHNLFELLRALGADIRTKDGQGNRVCDVASDETWAKEIADLIANDSEDGPASDHTQRPKTAAGSSKISSTVGAQHEEQRSRECGNSGTASGGSRKKRSNKKKSKKANKDERGGLGDAEKESIIAAAATPSVKTVGAASASLFLKRLLWSVGTELEQTAAPDAVKELEEMLTEAVADTFARLRDVDIAASDKFTDVRHACAFIGMLSNFATSLSETTGLYSEPQVRLFIFSQAFQLVHLMQKLHRIDHAAITVPALVAVRALCDTNAGFSKFVVQTARIGHSLDRNAQVQELLGLLEKRILRVPFDKRGALGYRNLVQMYVKARSGIGLSQTASQSAFRALEWYVTNPLEDFKLVKALDGMDGCPWYFDLVTTSAGSVFQRLERDLRGMAADGTLRGVTCFGEDDKRIVYGGASKADVLRVRELVLKAAERVGVQFAESSTSRACTPSLRVASASAACMFCQVERQNLEFRQESESSGGASSLTSLTLSFEKVGQNPSNGVAAFLGLVGSTLKSLTLENGGPTMRLNERSTMPTSCPFAAGFRSFRPDPWQGRNIDWHNVVNLSRDLSDMDNPFVQCVRHFRVWLDNAWWSWMRTYDSYNPPDSAAEVEAYW